MILLGLSHQKVSRRFHDIQSCCTTTRTTAYNCLQRGSFDVFFVSVFSTFQRFFQFANHGNFMQFRPSRTVETHLCQTPPAAWLVVVCHTMEQSLLPFAQRLWSCDIPTWFLQFVFTTWIVPFLLDYPTILLTGQHGSRPSSHLDAATL